MKFFIYARKSTDDEERQILSIQAQLDELRELARKESLTVAREYIEAQTAKEPGRPVFNDMMQALEKGDAHAILSWHPDRLARNSIDGGRVIYDLDTGKLATLKFPTHWFENTPQGKFMLQIAFGQSKYYVDNLSENIKRGIRKKLRDGIYPNKPPIGYLNDPKTRAIVIDPERGPLVRRMFETYATGQHTASQIKELVTAWGLTTFNELPLPLSKVLWTLDQVFYIGLFRFNGEVYEGKHPALISRDLFERVQRIRKNKGRGRYVKHNRFPFRGLITCHECGCSITSDIQKGHAYYRCGKRRGPCDLKTIREESLAQLLRASIRRVSISDAWADKMLAEVDRWTLADTATQADLVARQKVELARITARLDRLLEVFIDGTIGKDEFTAHKEKLTHEKTALAESIANFEAKGANRFKPLADFITASRQAKYDAQTEDIADLRNWHKKTGSNLIFAGRNLAEESGAGQADAAQAASRSESVSGDSSPASRGPRGGSAARFRLRPEASAGQAAFQTSENPQQIGAFVASRPAPSGFFPILPADVSAVASSGEVFRSLGSRTDPVLHVRFPAPWSVVAENRHIAKWRRGWDSNPRTTLWAVSRFRVECL